MRELLTTSQPPELIEAVKQEAARRGQNLSEYVGEVLLASLTAKAAKGLRAAVERQVRYKPRVK